MKDSNQIWLIIGRAPQLGQVKTRLAKTLGDERALAFYKAFIQDFFEGLHRYDSHCQLVMASTPTGESAYFKELLSAFNSPVFWAQPELSFFERLASLFERVASEFGSDTWVNLTGTDLPDFPFHFLSNEATSLLGPDPDGGFYFLRAQAKHADLFCWESSVQDGDATVCETLKCRASELGLELKILPPWQDVDTEADLRDLLKRSSSSVLKHTNGLADHN